MAKLVIGGRTIQDDGDCFVIAEIGHNHQGKVNTAMAMFKTAKECGADAVKLQKRNNKVLFTAEMYKRPYDNRNSYGDTYGEHREALEFGWEEFVDLKAYAQELDIVFFATAFDEPSADFLAKLDVPVFKIASADLKNIPLLKHVARFGKPMIVSTGGAEMTDVQRAYDAIKPINPQLCLLQCTAGYPAEFEELNLNVISTYKKRFRDIIVGLSSHDSGIAMAVAAYVLGARVIEKHFTLNRAWKGTDHAFSLEPTGLRKVVRDLRRTHVALGDGQKTVYESEVKPITKMAKSIVAARDLQAGHIIRPSDIAFKSPGGGLAPYEFEKVIGRVIQTPIQVDENITYEALEVWEQMSQAVA